jgi:hypothetical protein
MRRFDVLLGLMLLLLVTGYAGAQYWFQSGAQGDYKSAYNYGGSVSIETVSPQSVAIGSLAYWVGETLSNGAFIQVGYEVPNATGYLPQTCDLSGCTGRVLLNASEPAWFWEYFPAYSNSQSGFYGGIGGEGLLGVNGTFNTYSFNSTGNTWNLYVNNQQVGSVNLGTSTSGQNPIIAIGEYANAESSAYSMPDVTFRNLQTYNNKNYVPVTTGYSTISFGKASKTNTQNPYGVAEVGNQTDYFVVGSGLPLYNTRLLWNLGYHLNVISSYGAINSTGNYTAFAAVRIAAPQYINMTPTTRMAFTGWAGTGLGSYTGKSNATTIQMNGNITERAQWSTQYYVNVTSKYGIATGGGWQFKNSTGFVSLDENTVMLGAGKRVVFTGWSNGELSNNFNFVVLSPSNITAQWSMQYMVNGTTPYGNVIGNGWYNANSTATLSLSSPVVNATPTARTAFERWSNGDSNSPLEIKVGSPLLLSAMYSRQYLVNLEGEDAYGKGLNISQFVVNGNNTGAGIFAYPDKVYTVDNAYYKGVWLKSNDTISNVTRSYTNKVALPVYNITIGAYDYLDVPLNTTLNITFWNRTTLNTHLGPTGRIVIKDVPYGYAYGYESFLGELQSVNIAYGGTSTPTFLTPLITASILISIIIIFLIERFYFFEEEKGLRPQPGKRRSDRNYKRK